jgi:hypothetical protein
VARNPDVEAFGLQLGGQGLETGAVPVEQRDTRPRPLVLRADRGFGLLDGDAQRRE